jgi:hypothetical protein
MLKQSVASWFPIVHFMVFRDMGKSTHFGKVTASQPVQHPPAQNQRVLTSLLKIFVIYKVANTL